MSASAQHDLPALVLVVAALVGLLALGEWLRARRGWATESTRKLAHVASGCAAAAFPWLFSSVAAVLALSSGFLVLMALTRRQRRLRAVHAVGRRTGGGLYFPCAVAATFVLAGDRRAAYVSAMLVLALGDSAAALVGRRLGRHRYRLGGAPKSLEGSLTLFAVASVASLASLRLLGGLTTGEAALWALATAGLATLIEAAAPEGSDNLLLPLAVVLVLRHAAAAAPARLTTLVLVASASAVLLSLLAVLRHAPTGRAGGRAGWLGVRPAAFAALSRGGPW